MSTYASNVWDQLKNITVEELMKALKKDGWELDTKSGAVQVFLKGKQRVTIHFHPGKTYSAGLLKALLQDIGWTETAMRKLKLIK